jgi:hypothetical protein
MRRARALVLMVCVLLAVAMLPAAASDVRVMPLSAPTPAWYTPSLHAEVVAAGAEGVPIPDGVELPASALAFTGIRPGSWMLFPAWCTMNFVFNGSGGGSDDSQASGPGQGNGQGKGPSGEAEREATVPVAGAASGSGLAIGTAGHCAEAGDEVTLVMAPGVLVYIGDAVRSVDDGPGNDFALVAIRDEVADLVNPSMAIVAGPTTTGDPEIPDPVLHVGHGAVVGTGGTARPGIVTYRDGDAYAWDGVAAPGDSGSPVRHADGEAVGNLTHLVVGGPYLPAIIAGTTAERMEQIAGMRIATASLVPDPFH